MNRPTVLAIEDDRRYRDLLELNLTRHGYRALLAADGLTGLNLLERDRPDAIILDLALPDMDGFEVCRRIRGYSTIPLVILSARSDEPHKVRALRGGADDYVTKPFGADELMARLEAVLRRSHHGSAVMTPLFSTDGLTINFATREVKVDGANVHLTPAEFKLLHHLALNAGRILVQEELVDRVWGAGYQTHADVLHTTVRRLRRKIEPDPASPRYVLTHRGIGYLLRAPAAPELQPR